MLQNIKIIGLAGTIVIALCTQAQSQQLLTGDDVSNQIIGHSFKGRKGILSVTLRYEKDGTVVMQSPLGKGAGVWAILDNSLCVNLTDGPRKTNECLTFSRETGGTYRASNGMRLTPLK